MAVPEAVPMYLNVYCGKALWNCGPIRFGIRPESDTSLVPMTVRVLPLSAAARPGETSSIAAVARPASGAASLSRPRVRVGAPARAVRRVVDGVCIRAAYPAHMYCLCKVLEI